MYFTHHKPRSLSTSKGLSCLLVCFPDGNLSHNQFSHIFVFKFHKTVHPSIQNPIALRVKLMVTSGPGIVPRQSASGLPARPGKEFAPVQGLPDGGQLSSI